MTGPGPFDQVLRDSTPRVLTALLRRNGDFGTAEDAVQEALLAASRQWPVEGVPTDPGAWLITVASRRLSDAVRSERARAAREETVARRVPPGPGGWATVPPADSATATDRDASLALYLLCCHPVLARPSQVALTLRAVGGLSTARIARAFLVPEATMAQRISRAKARLRASGARFVTPPAVELPGRVAAVAAVLYLVFTEGHTATTGAGLTDTPLTVEAIRLTRELQRLVPADDEVTGLLALLLLSDARRPARIGPDGALVPLVEQDRSRWDRDLIAEGVALVERVLPAGPVGPYQLQAAIAAVHADAADAAATDWPQIVALYRMLAAIDPGPVVGLNHAVAVAEVDGPEAGLALIEPLVSEPGLARGHRLHAVRGHLLERAGRDAEALLAFETAARLATSVPERRHLAARIAGLRPDH